MVEEKELKRRQGNLINFYRRIKRLTQQELGDKLGYSNGVISGYERGRTSPSSIEMEKIANILERDLNDFKVISEHY